MPPFKRHFITYSDNRFLKQKRAAILFAKLFGGFDSVTGYTPNDIDEKFRKEYSHILTQKRGGGYWLWKPYFILKKLNEIEYNDFLFYSDAGALLLKNIKVLIDELSKHKQDIMGFELPLIEKQWTKKELFKNLDCQSQKCLDSNQIMASFILIKKTSKSLLFFEKFLQTSCNEINITDKMDINIQSGHFIDHRHDQSIFSLLFKKHGLKPFKDPTQYSESRYIWGYSGQTTNKKAKVGQYLLSNGRLYNIKMYDESYGRLFYHVRKGTMISFFKYLVKQIVY